MLLLARRYAPARVYGGRYAWFCNAIRSQQGNAQGRGKQDRSDHGASEFCKYTQHTARQMGVETRAQSPGYTTRQNPGRRARHIQGHASQRLGNPMTRVNGRPAKYRPRPRQREGLMTPNGDRAIGPGLTRRGHTTRKPAFEIKFALAPRGSLPAATAAGLVTEAASNRDTGLG